MLSGFENPFHLLITAVAILMRFGAKRPPEVGLSLGSGMREFRDGVLGREPSAPSQEVLESSAQTADRTRRSDPAG
jgi:TatA/E family protein of Tat protein translocase